MHLFGKFEVDDKARGDEGTKQNKRYSSSQKEKGNEVVIYNPFDALNHWTTQKRILGVLTHAAPLVVIHVESRSVECPGAE